jgi:hypothetical protein
LFPDLLCDFCRLLRAWLDRFGVLAMTTLMLADLRPARAAEHPLCRVVAAVRQRADKRRLGFIDSDDCLRLARDHFAAHGDEARAIKVGRARDDVLAILSKRGSRP